VPFTSAAGPTYGASAQTWRVGCTTLAGAAAQCPAAFAACPRVQ
jgi:hypothetical protein